MTAPARSCDLNDCANELVVLLSRLRGLSALVQMIHDDEEGSPILDDLRDEDRAGVLELVHVLVVRAEALFGDIYGELPLAPSRRS